MSALLDGLKLMLTGMGMVFLFLCLMIGWIYVSSRLSVRFAHLLPDEPPEHARPRPASGEAEDDETTIAVITAALRRYRQEHFRQNGH